MNEKGEKNQVLESAARLHEVLMQFSILESIDGEFLNC
jgi:hypothetical protein